MPSSIRQHVKRAIPSGVTLSPIEIIASGLAAVALLYASTFSSENFDEPLFLAPLAASIAIMFTSPGTTATRSWNVIAGQFISALIAVTLVSLIGYDFVAAPLAFSLALIAMRVAKCLHPPACATVMIICLDPAAQSLEFVFFPVLVGSIFIVCFAWIVHVIEGRVPPSWGGRTTPDHGQPPSPTS